MIDHGSLISSSVVVARDALEQCLIQKQDYATLRRKEFKKLRRENARNEMRTL